MTLSDGTFRGGVAGRVRAIRFPATSENGAPVADMADAFQTDTSATGSACGRYVPDRQP